MTSDKSQSEDSVTVETRLGDVLEQKAGDGAVATVRQRMEAADDLAGALRVLVDAYADGEVSRADALELAERLRAPPPDGEDDLPGTIPGHGDDQQDHPGELKGGGGARR